MTTKTILLASLVILGALGLAQAQQGHSGHGAHGAAPAAAPANPATRAFQAANAKMHKDMDISYTGDADIDFMKGMIPHHQGAIDMARVALLHGKDPAVKKLATDVIAAQQAEIAMMKGWLKQRGH